MMKYEKVLELHIECHSSNSGELAELGIDSDDTEWRPCLINVNFIQCVYKYRDGGTLIIIHGEDFRFKESYEEIKAMINEV